MAFSLTLMVTGACDLACGYCYHGGRQEKEMSLPTASAALDWALAQEQAGDGLLLNYFGGEPLLALNRLGEIHALAGEKCRRAGVPLRSFLATNGTRLDSTAWNFLMEGGIEPTVSLDGWEAGHDALRRDRAGRGSFARIWENLQASPLPRDQIRLHLVLAPGNAAHLADSLETLIAQGFRRFLLSPDYGGSWDAAARALARQAFARSTRLYIQELGRGTPVLFSWIEEKVRRLVTGTSDCGRVCTLGSLEMAVDPQGNFFPCERMIPLGPGSNLCLGSLWEDPPKVELAREALAAGRALPPACLSCPDRILCTNFCACVNHRRTGQIDLPDDLVCFFERLAIEAAREAAQALLHDA